MKINGFLLLLSAIALIIGCKADDKDNGVDTNDTSGNTACPWDEDDEHANAGSLDLGSEVSGFICPRGDQDWYSFTMPADNDLISVALSLDAPVSPIGPTYSVWSGDGTEVIASPESSESVGPGKSLNITHYIPAGQYFVVVRDRADDAEDTRHSYSLTMTSAKDKDVNEPNNTAEEAGASTSSTGYISYRGDEDWYRVDAPSGGLIDVQFTMPVSGIEPSFKIVDAEGNQLISQSNPAGTAEQTDMNYIQSLAQAGTYFVVVSDDNGLNSDPDTAYEIQIELLSDPDQNESNNDPTTATALPSTLTCGAQWSEWVDMTGYIGGSGDVDWFQVDLQGCGRALIEAQVTFDSPSTMPDDLEAAVRLVRSVSSVSCTDDSHCHELPRNCEVDLECNRIGNSCLINEGVCGGANICMPDGTCGADLIFETSLGSNPAQVTLSSPIFSLTPLYLVVSDYHSDAHSLTNSYTLRVRVRTDPDTHESSEAFTAGPPTDQDPMGLHTQVAKEIPIHDCAGGTCCDSTTWTQGYLSYNYDQDWYKYQHPCPGQDCMVRVVYELDAGPVDFYFRVGIDGNDSWFDNLAETVDSGSHGASSGHFGGLDANDFCLYSYFGHEADDTDPFWYYVSIRDTNYVSEGHEEDGTWDWSADQSYRFCVEKIADGCLEPCHQYDTDGCGVAPEEE